MEATSFSENLILDFSDNLFLDFSDNLILDFSDNLILDFRTAISDAVLFKLSPQWAFGDGNFVQRLDTQLSTPLCISRITQMWCMHPNALLCKSISRALGRYAEESRLSQLAAFQTCLLPNFKRGKL